jgi:hypothetical protein
LHPLKSPNLVFGKQKTPFWGHAAPPLHPLKTRKPFFWKQEPPFWGHAHEQNRRISAFWHPPPKTGFNGAHAPLTINGVAFRAPKKFRKLPSAASNLHKSISSISILDIFFVHFLKIFSTLVQSKSKNNKIILQELL